MSRIEEAEAAIRQKWAREGFKGKLQYDPAKIIENERWWFIPCGWIGSFGCIVNKSDKYVNWLGSSVMTMEDCFWGHDHGVFYDLVDFSFNPETNIQLATQLLARFQHMRPNARGMLPKQPVPYRDSEISEALSTQFPVFRHHFVWYAIPELRKASERDGLLFTSVLCS